MQRVVWVTGGHSGIGREIAEQCAARGDCVFVSDVISVEQNTLSSPITYLVCDVSNAADVATAHDAIIAHAGRLDVLINNAGITADGLVVRMDEETWNRVMRVNATGTFLCSQQALKTMMRQKSGYIISLSSVVATTGNSGQANYAASKASIEAFTKSIAKEYGSRGIRANAIAPGFISTPMTARLPQTVIDAAIAQTALQRAGTPRDVANLVLFLTSGAADYITGQIIHINGGMC